MKRLTHCWLLWFLAALAGLIARSDAAALPQFDFARSTDAQAWQAAHDISKLASTAEGLLIEISGGDPYLHGPPRDYPAQIGLWLNLRLKSDQAGTCQVFYFAEGSGATEANSVRFDVPAGQWFESRAVLPPLGPRYQLRIDPPGTGGQCLLGSLRFHERVPMVAPDWPKPELPRLSPDDLSVQSGELQLNHQRDFLGAFEVLVDGERMAAGHSRALIGYVEGTKAHWLAWRNFTPVRIENLSKGFVMTGSCLDADAGRWEIRQQFTTGALSGAIDVETRVTVSRDRSVAYLPLVTLFPGLGGFQTNKTQALFAGVEYLENEPSSSEADLKGPASQRQVPDSLKLTFPLMALCAKEKYIGLVWDQHPDYAAFFDSPDRLLHSGAHVMGFLFPGSNGTSRDESNPLPYGGQLLRANEPLIQRATIVGGAGRSVVPAIQKFVALRGLPPVPSPGMSANEYFSLASAGWLDSKIRQGDLYRHAFWKGFGAQGAADAALWMDWLAVNVSDSQLAARLTAAAQGSLSQVPSPNYNVAAIGHIRYPAPALVYGAVHQNAKAALDYGRNLLQRFQPDGTIHYQKPASGVDYASTHFARHANGLTAQVVQSLLEAGVFSGNKELIADGLKQVRALGQYRNGVPRGAQTWEIPLHTPDILAAAQLVRVYTLAYEITGDSAFIDEAKYWAWTGVPFVYLRDPTGRAIGTYATIPVLGATGWTAPVWIGLPVQWCGLVYAEALYGLAKHDPQGPWRQIADGITVTGMQMTWPSLDADRKGLLPDIFQLRAQHRDGPAINPATLLAPALRYWRKQAPYDFHCFRRHGFLVHAPGKIDVLSESADRVQFAVSSWSKKPYKVLINGVLRDPKVRINGVDSPKAPMQYEYQQTDARLILQLEGKATVEILGARE
jgi:hypothetical protein